MLISQAFPRRFANAEDLGDQPHTLRIAKVTQEKVGPVTKPVLWFFGARKGIILSATLARQIAKLHGDDTDAWSGQPVTLHTIPCRGMDGHPARSIRARAATLELQNSRTPELPQLRNPHRLVAQA